MDHSTMDHAHMDHSTMDHSGHAGHSMDHSGHLMQSNTDAPMINHSNHGHGSMDGMSMAFHFGCTETILIEQWSIDSVGGLLGSMVAIILMGALYEGLKYYREYLFWKTYNSLQYRAVSVPDKPVVNEDTSRVVHMVGEVIHKQPPTMLSAMHAYQTLLHILQVTVSFLLMLIFMTYNVWLCLAVVIGAAGGYFLFGWRKSVIVDVTEHCH
ncbi:high affinity copper uptake protein 1 isoform X2 [Bradysia coprophila]|uniref:high affinity copper uptake protein 1 isoform X2 n=1 Tax=Bradysia coprophila TaxID=38358 RepID=UPI00187DB10F|nr:high affinity copper uptake protein 1 isoform X2 [Bradysia coprophila]XP_037029272.1 high affinity copper uptake protein 1 isoform X2 [Bradysia coprophila]XP_037029282.1 high affinity copper uptake protein 1 isoform X2 [Bradysia coprophila]XP_037029291.1 high affinity copper uptake protein 1 isoform X2 [Bradysia coprophila]